MCVEGLRKRRGRVWLQARLAAVGTRIDELQAAQATDAADTDIASDLRGLSEKVNELGELGHASMHSC